MITNALVAVFILMLILLSVIHIRLSKLSFADGDIVKVKNLYKPDEKSLGQIEYIEHNSAYFDCFYPCPNKKECWRLCDWVITVEENMVCAGQLEEATEQEKAMYCFYGPNALED